MTPPQRAQGEFQPQPQPQPQRHFSTYLKDFLTQEEASWNADNHLDQLSPHTHAPSFSSSSASSSSSSTSSLSFFPANFNCDAEAPSPTTTIMSSMMPFGQSLGNDTMADAGGGGGAALREEEIDNVMERYIREAEALQHMETHSQSNRDLLFANHLEGGSSAGIAKDSYSLELDSLFHHTERSRTTAAGSSAMQQAVDASTLTSAPISTMHVSPTPMSALAHTRASAPASSVMVSHMPSNAANAEPQYFQISCQQCRKSHRRCDRLLPTCSNCSIRGIECIYTPPKKRRRKEKSDSDAQSISGAARATTASTRKKTAAKASTPSLLPSSSSSDGVMVSTMSEKQQPHVVTDKPPGIHSFQAMQPSLSIRNNITDQYEKFGMLPVVPQSNKFSSNQLINFYATFFSKKNFVTRELLIQILPTREREMDLIKRGELKKLRINRVLYQSSMSFALKLLGDKDVSKALFENSLKLALDPSLYMIQSSNINLASAWINMVLVVLDSGDCNSIDIAHQFLANAKSYVAAQKRKGLEQLTNEKRKQFEILDSSVDGLELKLKMHDDFETVPLKQRLIYVQGVLQRQKAFPKEVLGIIKQINHMLADRSLDVVNRTTEILNMLDTVSTAARKGWWGFKQCDREHYTLGKLVIINATAVDIIADAINEIKQERFLELGSFSEQETMAARSRALKTLDSLIVHHYNELTKSIANFGDYLPLLGNGLDRVILKATHHHMNLVGTQNVDQKELRLYLEIEKSALLSTKKNYGKVTQELIDTIHELERNIAKLSNQDNKQEPDPPEPSSSSSQTNDDMPGMDSSLTRGLSDDRGQSSMVQDLLGSAEYSRARYALECTRDTEEPKFLELVLGHATNVE